MKTSSRTWSLGTPSTQIASVFAALVLAFCFSPSSSAQDLTSAKAINSKITVPVVATVTVGQLPVSLVVSPDSQFVYVADASGVSVIDAATNQVRQLQSPIVLDGIPSLVVFTPDSSHAYVAAYVKTRHPLLLIDTATESVTSVVKTGNLEVGGYGSMLFSPDATKFYVTATSLTSSASLIAVLDTANNRIKSTIPITTKRVVLPGQAGITPDGKYLFVPLVSRQGNPEGDVKVDIVDLITQKRLSTQITVGYQPVAVAPNGNNAYVANYYSSSVSVLNISSE